MSKTREIIIESKKYGNHTVLIDLDRDWETKDVRDRLGLEVRVMHVSALVENTRPSHAARHGKIYTLEDEREWQHEGSNMISCLCSTVEVVFVNGEPTQKKLIERQRKRGEAFFAMHPEKA